MVPAAGGGGAREGAAVRVVHSRAERETRTDVRHALSRIRRLAPDDNGSGLLFLRHGGANPFSRVSVLGRRQRRAVNDPATSAKDAKAPWQWSTHAERGAGWVRGLVCDPRGIVALSLCCWAG